MTETYRKWNNFKKFMYDDGLGQWFQKQMPSITEIIAEAFNGEFDFYHCRSSNTYKASLTTISDLYNTSDTVNVNGNE